MILLLLTLAFIILLIRTFFVLYDIHKNGRDGGSSISRQQNKPPRKRRTSPACTVVVLGSGGHTSEMFNLLKGISPSRYSPLVHIVASTDSTSEDRVLAAAAAASALLPQRTIKIPRSREVGQSYLTSILTTLHALIYSFWVIAKLRPNVVICNGPGTCLPIVLCAFVWRILGWCEGKVVFVESFCRVQTLSLTGLLLYPIVDRFVVHWTELHDKYPRSELIETFVRHKSNAAE